MERLKSDNMDVLAPRWETHFSEIKDEFQTGDIILVHGRYPFSWVVTMLQLFNSWGHVAMVIRREDIDPDNILALPELLLWEANTDDGPIQNLWEPLRGIVKQGPMLISLEERLRHTQSNYQDVEIAYRPLHANRANIDFSLLRNYFNKVIEKRFPSNSEIIHSIYLGRRYNRTSEAAQNNFNLNINFDLGNISIASIDLGNILENLGVIDLPDKNEIYCAELIAATYKKLGLLTSNHVSNAYSPKDFCSEGDIRLLKGARLGPEVFIDMLN